MLHIAGLSLRDLSEMYYVTMASRESVRRWCHRFSRIFSVEKKFRDTVGRFFRYIKQRTRRFYNNINTWSIKSIEDYASAIAIIRNLTIAIKIQWGVLPGWQDPFFHVNLYLLIYENWYTVWIKYVWSSLSAFCHRGALLFLDNLSSCNRSLHIHWSLCWI